MAEGEERVQGGLPMFWLKERRECRGVTSVMGEGEERGQGGLPMLWLKERREGREGCQCYG